MATYFARLRAFEVTVGCPPYFVDSIIRELIGRIPSNRWIRIPQALYYAMVVALEIAPFATLASVSIGSGESNFGWEEPDEKLLDVGI